MSTLVRGLFSVVGRFMLCLIFLLSAVANKIPNFADTVDKMDKAGVPYPQFALVGAIVFLIAGSISLLIGYRARIGSLLLIVFLVLASYYFHDFWEHEGDEKQQQMIQFMKNLAIMGGMLMVFANGPGPMSLDDKIRTLRAKAS